MPYIFRCDRCFDEEEVGIMDYTLEASCEDCGWTICTRYCLVDGLCTDCRKTREKKALDNEDDGA